MMSQPNFPFYARQTVLPHFGRSAQVALHKAHVTVVGAGGLGSPALLYLAGAGVGHITVVDSDQVAYVNLHRQVIFEAGQVGRPKAQVAAERLRALNPSIRIEARALHLDNDNALDILSGSDLVIDATDNLPVRHAISHAAQQLRIPHVWGAICGYEAQVSVFSADDGLRYEDLVSPETPHDAAPNAAQAGAFGPVIGMAGSMLASEAIKLITGIGSPLIGHIAIFDWASNKWEYLRLKPRR